MGCLFMMGVVVKVFVVVATLTILTLAYFWKEICNLWMDKLGACVEERFGTDAFDAVASVIAFLDCPIEAIRRKSIAIRKSIVEEVKGVCHGIESFKTRVLRIGEDHVQVESQFVMNGQEILLCKKEHASNLPTEQWVKLIKSADGVVEVNDLDIVNRWSEEVLKN